MTSLVIEPMADDFATSMSTLIFQPEQRSEGRPTGVTLISMSLFVFALIAALYAALIVSGSIAMSRGAWVVGGGLEILGPGIFAMYALVHLVCAIGLWRMHKWALRLSSLLLLYGLIQVTPAISSAVAATRIPAIAREGAQILVRAAALWYLWQEPTRDSFDKK